MAIPGQQINIKDPGLGLVVEATATPLVLGTSELGTALVATPFSRKNDVVAQLGQGPLSESVCKILDLAGGPVIAMKLPSSVAPTLSAVTPTRVGSSTGTVSVAIRSVNATKALQFDDSLATFVDETADLASAAAGDVDPFPATEAIGDYFAVGYVQPFAELSLTIATAGAAGVVAVEYYDGTAWQAVTGLSDATVGLTAAPGTYSITYTLPNDWVALSLNGSAKLYYLRLRVTTVYTTNPVLTSGSIKGHGGFDRYEAAVEILKTGTLGVGTFRYSLDNETSYSSELVIPVGGTFLIPSTGLQLTFTPGAGPTFFEDGDLHRFTTTEPLGTAADIQAAVDALLATSTEFGFAVVAGVQPSAAAAATLFAALDTHGLSFENVFRYVAFMLDAGSADTTSTVQTEFASVSSRRVSPAYGLLTQVSSKPFAGYTAPRRSGVEVLAGRAADSLISTDLARVADGPLPGVQATSHDEALDEALDAHGITTFRSHIGRAGIFCTNGRIKAPAGSDFQFWQFRRVMDVACRRVFVEQQNFLNIGVRTKADGTIDERDASRLETVVNEALRAELSQPVNAEGTPGHVSALSYRIDRTNNIAQTLRLQSEVAIRPLGYAKTIVTEIGYALNA